MARTTGPLFSFDASGTIAGAVVFSKWRGRNYVRRHAIPMNPKSALQVSVRAMMAFIAHSWQSHATIDQNSWLVPADAKNYSTFNAYVAANMLAWKHFEWPTKRYPRNPVSTPPGAPTTIAAGGVGLLTLPITAGSPAATWGYGVHIDTTTGFSPTNANLVGIVPYTATPLILVVSPLLADTYYLRVTPFNDDGVAGTPSSEDSAIVT